MVLIDSLRQNAPRPLTFFQARPRHRLDCAERSPLILTRIFASVTDRGLVARVFDSEDIFYYAGRLRRLESTRTSSAAYFIARRPAGAVPSAKSTGLVVRLCQPGGLHSRGPRLFSFRNSTETLDAILISLRCVGPWLRRCVCPCLNRRD